MLLCSNIVGRVAQLRNRSRNYDSERNYVNVHVIHHARGHRTHFMLQLRERLRNYEGSVRYCNEHVQDNVSEQVR